MNSLKMPLALLCLAAALLGSAGALAVTSSDFSTTPPNITDASDPFVMISLSVEGTQQAEAYTDGEQTLVGGTYCPGRDGSWGICYTDQEEYLGYFDANKCYVYDTSGSNTNTLQLATGPLATTDAHHFRPVGSATNHQCSGSQFSGNFMNWASMTALDEFRSAMTGGARLLDTAGANAKTWLTRAHRYSGSGDWPFVRKRIRSTGITVSGNTFTTDPADVTPFSVSELRVDYDGSSNGNNTANRIRFKDSSGNTLGTYNVIVEVCNASVGLEANCTEYSDGTNTWYKPEGVMHQHALEMRYALTSYSAEDDNIRNGGVLRANAKYIGALRPVTGGGLEVNPAAEIDTQGLIVFNPDGETLGSGVNNSGIINYINSFALGPERYKSKDPVAELYYEGLRYIKNLGRTPEYADAYGASLAALTPDQKDNFPVITAWDDPILNACQANFIVAVGDQFAWGDNSLPGATVTGSGAPSSPSNPDNDINVDTLTDTVGTLENYHPGTLGGETRGRDNNGWYFAGLTYYAATQDLRSDFSGDQKVKTFVVDTQEYNSSPPMQQDNPFWLAAKYGGFEDENGDNDPNNGVPRQSTDEWDADGDGEPDAYTLASQPANLIAGLGAAFSDVSERVSAGSAASVVTNSSSGEGAIYQGLYKPSDVVGNDRVEWVGILHALFVDNFGNFREDTDGNAMISNADKVITFDFDAATEETLVTRHTTTDGGSTFTPDGTPGVDIEDLDTIWNARDALASVNDYTTQRNYPSGLANTARYIFTGLDTDADGIVTSAETVDFDAAEFPTASSAVNNNFRYLGLDSGTGDGAPDIVNFIRGVEGISGFRSRSIDYDGDGAREAWLLGDIIHASPLAISRPASRFDLLYGDETYRNYRQQYFDRRTVIYAGGNDGMLHAFNGGFYSSVANGFLTKPDPSSTVQEHPLGTELWAYVPFNVLPHLRWLTELGYPHVYYVDGIPQVFDVNIFSDDATHPDGWGTILVVGLRFGGGDITFDPDSDTDADTSDDITTRSSYIILDITDPEQPPSLVAEISHPEMGYATTRATLIKNRQRNVSDGTFSNPADNEWYLVMGSGPFGSNAANRRVALTDGVSDQNAKVFVFDLVNKSFVETTTPGDASFEVTGASGAFVGDLTSVDWDRDFADDVVYFGTVGGSVAAPIGELMRFVPGSSFNLTNSSFSTLLNKTGGLDQPFNGRPHVSTSINGDHWVHVGTGRFYVAEDSLTTAQQSFYGIKEPLDSSRQLTLASVAYNDLIDTTGIEVSSDGSVRRSGADPTLNNGDTVSTFSELRASIAGEPGWRFDFSDPAARNVGQIGFLNFSILLTEFIPSGDACDPLGETFLNAVHFETGTSAPFAALGLSSTAFNTGYVTNQRVLYGVGLVRDVITDNTSGRSRVVGQDSTGGLMTQDIAGPDAPEGRMSWRELQIDW